MRPSGSDRDTPEGLSQHRDHPFVSALGRHHKHQTAVGTQQCARGIDVRLGLRHGDVCWQVDHQAPVATGDPAELSAPAVPGARLVQMHEIIVYHQHIRRIRQAGLAVVHDIRLLAEQRTYDLGTSFGKDTSRHRMALPGLMGRCTEPVQGAGGGPPCLGARHRWAGKGSRLGDPQPPGGGCG